MPLGCYALIGTSMKSLFRKKSTVETAVDVKSAYASIQFSGDHGYMADMSIIGMKDVLESELAIYQKLKVWLRKHPDTQEYLEMRKSCQQPDQNYHGFRQYAVKSQILAGFELISQYEQWMQARPNFECSEHPFPEVRDLWEVSQLWTAAKRAEIKCQVWTAEVKRLIGQRLFEIKSTAARLVSLLASIDAIPLDHIPVVKFEALRTTEEEILASIPRCVQLQCHIDKMRSMNSVIFQKIGTIAIKYGKGGELDSVDLQAAAFHRLIASYKVQYNDNARSMKIGTNSGAFLDFLVHPNSSAYPLYKKFIDNPVVDAYRELTADLIQFYGIQSADECSIINALVSHAFAPMLLPKVAADGKGGDDIDALAYGIELFGIDDPLVVLHTICENLDIDDVDAGITKACSALEMITSSHLEILRFVYDFTSTEYLSAKMNSVRFMIGKVLNLE